MIPYCPECALPVNKVEGKTYIATSAWIWKADGSMEDSYQFNETFTFASIPCRITIVFPNVKV